MINDNNVKLSGQILSGLEYSHSNNGEDFYFITIGVKRDSGVIDKIILCISGRMGVDFSVENGVYVYVEGQIRTYNEKCVESDHIKLKTYVLVDCIREIDVNNKEDLPILNKNDNSVFLTGFMCKKSNVRKTPGGRIICDCIIAVNRNYGKADYIPCIFWGKNAKYTEMIEVGQELSIEGRIQSREYKKDQDIKIAYEVSVISMNLIDE